MYFGRYLLIFKRLPFKCCALFVGMLTNSVYADSFYTADIGLNHDDNILSGQQSLAFADKTAVLALEYGNSQIYGAGNRFTYAGQAEYVHYDEYYGLNHINIGARLRYDKKLGIGQYVPKFHGQMSLNHLDYESDERDVWRYALSLGLGKPISNSTQINTKLTYTRSQAHTSDSVVFWQNKALDNDVFSQDALDMQINWEYAVTNEHFLLLHYQYRHGDVDSIGDKNNLFKSANAVLSESAVAKHHPDTWIYKFNATSHVISAGWDWLINENMILGIHYQRKISHSDINYHRDVFGLKLTYGN